jgi:hypothetical protein
MARTVAGLVSRTAVSSVGGTPLATRDIAPEPWILTRHSQDDGFDQIAGRHRIFLDAISPRGAGEALTYANNFQVASRQGYPLGEADTAIVICLRHRATPFAFSDATWAKYGAIMTDRSRFTDPKTDAAPAINVYPASTDGMQLPNRGKTFIEAARHRVHFAACDLSRRALAGLAAERMHVTAASVHAELRASMHANPHTVPAGVAAVDRAQERRYSVAHSG